MRLGKYLLYYWLPPLVWMGLIFFSSAQYRVSVTHRYLYDFIIFKTLHMTEYAILYFLFFRAFYSLKKTGLTLDKVFIISFLMAVFYAVTDEVHQLFVYSREGSVRDILIDIAGILIMYTLIKNYKLKKNEKYT